jgi:hypothetical protein
VSFHQVGLRDIQSSYQILQKEFFGEDINDASLNLGAGAFYYTENYYSFSIRI